MKARIDCHGTCEMTFAVYAEACAWYTSRPPVVRALIDRMPPGSWWQLRDGSQPVSRYTVLSYSEDGTVSCTRYQQTGLAPDGRLTVAPLWNVFGMPLDDFAPAERCHIVAMTPELQATVDTALGHLIEGARGETRERGH